MNVPATRRLRAGSRRREGLSFESLERRELLSHSSGATDGEPAADESQLVGGITSGDQLETVGSFLQEFRLGVPETEDVALYQASLKNNSAHQARFTMRLNKQVSVNVQDLANQIRNLPLDEAAHVPDYERAYHYLMRFHQHDFPLTGRVWQHEPSVYLNSLGFGLCDDAASALHLIWDAMGYESRIWLLRGHVVAEVYTGERWQMYDPDLRVVYFNRQDQVAGVEELVTQPDLITQPTDPVSTNASLYSGRMASIYSTTENNAICTGCTQDIAPRDLIFEIPAGGTMSWGRRISDKVLPVVTLDSPTKFGQIKITIPAGSRGSLDIPLALYDVRGDERDVVSIGGTNLSLGSNEVFEFLNMDVRQGNRMHAIHFQDNLAPIEVLYFFNERFARILPENMIEIEQLTETPAQLSAELQKRVAFDWSFGTSTSTPARSGLRFEGDGKFLDLSSSPASSMFVGNAQFSIETRFKLDAGDATRRPLADAYRFSLEIDAQNRPYVYFRQDNDRWLTLHGDPLSVEQWHEVSVQYDRGRISLAVNGELRWSRVGRPMSSQYPQYGLYIGKSEHLGGLYFRGELARVSLQDDSGSAADPAFEIVHVPTEQLTSNPGDAGATEETTDGVAVSTVAHAPPERSDLDLDARITGDDLQSVLDHYGKAGAENIDGDLVGDWLVDLGDYRRIAAARLGTTTLNGAKRSAHTSNRQS